MPTIFHKENIFHFIKEAAWMAITALIIYAVLWPVEQKIDFLYYKINAFFIFITLTYFRWTVTFRSLPFFRPALVRFLVFTGNMVMFILLTQQEQKFLMFIDNFEVQDFGYPKIGVFMFDHVKENLFKYLYGEIVLFGTGSLIMIVVFNTRLLVSWWQYYKYRASALLED